MSRPIPEEEDEEEKHQKAAKIQCVELKDRYARDNKKSIYSNTADS